MTMNLETSGSDPIVIREIHEITAIRAVEQLQKEIWGLPDLEVVPVSQLVAAAAAGGVLLGAFNKNRLIGFAYGFPGYEDGLLTHHSHMLGVLPGYRNCNIGYRLKLAQRKHVLEQGIEIMSWTFDPLQSLNAYFNLNRLGAISDRYLINFYGEDAASFLHGNGTDRLWITWLLTSSRVSDRIDNKDDSAARGNTTPLVELVENNVPSRNDLNACLSTGAASIEIPIDINEIERQNKEVAARWREATRWAFGEAIENGFIVDGFRRSEKYGRALGTYHLSRK